MKRFVAWLAVIFGLIGLLACVGGIATSWVARDTVIRSSLSVLDSVDETLEVGEDRTGRVSEGIRLVRDVVSPVAKSLAAQFEKASRASPEDEKELRRQVAELASRLRNIEKMVEAVQTVVRLSRKTAKTAEKLPFSSKLAPRLSSMDEMKDSSISLDRLATFLDRVHEAISQLRQDKGLQRELITEIGQLATEVETRLNTLQGRVDGLLEEVKTARSEVVEVRVHLADWIATAVLIITLLLTWMSLGQAALLCWGLARTRSVPPTRESINDSL